MTPRRTPQIAYMKLLRSEFYNGHYAVLQIDYFAHAEDSEAAIMKREKALREAITALSEVGPE